MNGQEVTSMAILVLPESAGERSTEFSISLRHWLDGRWAVLFSHPDDFVHCELELDRWIAIVGGAFRQARVQPIALARRQRPVDRGWISAASGTSARVMLYEEPRSDWCAVDLAARRLHEHISASTQRFAMIIDATMRRRKTFLYDAAERPPSPLDLIGLASKLRESAQQEAHTAIDRLPASLNDTRRTRAFA
jgi:alkyl hydroperoxide reductase subunit AhpC